MRGVIVLNLALLGIFTAGATAAQDQAAERIRTLQEQELDSLQQELDKIAAERGQKHADLLPILWSMRDVYIEHGAYAPAVALMERALEITEEVHGTDGGVTLTAIHKLTALYTLARDYPRARAVGERLRSTVERLLGPEHPALGPALSVEGEALLRAGDAAAAAQRLEPALAIQAENMGPAAHELTPIHLLLAEAHTRLGRVRRPEALLRYGLGIRSEARGFVPDDEVAFYLAPFKAALGGLYTAVGFYDEAEDALTEALEAYEAMLAADDPQLEPVLVHLATLYAATGDTAKAEEYGSRAERLFADNLGFAFVQSAPPFPPFAEIPPASDPEGLFADAATGDWVEYRQNGEPSERLEIVRATPALVVIAKSRRDGDRWVRSTEEMVRRDIGLREFHGVDSLTATRCPFVSGTIECLAWSYSGSYASEPATVFLAPGVVPVGGLLRRDFGGYRDTVRYVTTLGRYSRGGEVVKVPKLEGFPVMTEAVREIRSERELMEAAKRGDVRAVAAALDRGMDVDPIDGAPLNWAVRRGHVDMVRLLIERGARVGPDDLVRAARSGSVELASLLLEHDLDVNAVGGDLGVNDTPLFAAAEKGHRAMVEFLLQRGADPLATNGAGTTTLMGAAKAGDTELVSRFLDLGVDVNAGGGGSGRTALLFAAETGNPEVVRLLLETGANARDTTASGVSALYLVAPTGNVEVGELLIAAGADPNQGAGSEGYKRTPLMAAAEKGHAEFVRLLIRAGAEVNARLESGYTALEGAESNGHTEVVKILLEAGAKP
ncbi:MAG: tetratricopeptide repeat protein [Gemmatimonadetes bacterium]|uniref:Tetratricopeptide repeat protein n=1 Tax=Candidatus Kutchimonas denitrificans TaxID=3056748 RepID=A0AAE4ZA47_9BACT|nr:tetratricopeptide repeat protein [Gemmatimonadota bacterium]NIR76599.1 tetratricopeptide repeat protein [Candidatus Kutchimonas denitrificans]NIS01155.1 tetratricopeptide repeat protein [Gemmatimonadota bacterium]NIT66922.1 tetratricopeptide repeat protein [Gemmatimonadota bacterium]NIU54695.1 tetratricopeptide repeat protein [Gemmatimonadota bacterium]